MYIRHGLGCAGLFCSVSHLFGLLVCVSWFTSLVLVHSVWFVAVALASLTLFPRLPTVSRSRLRKLSILWGSHSTIFIHHGVDGRLTVKKEIHKKPGKGAALMFFLSASLLAAAGGPVSVPEPRAALLARGYNCPSVWRVSSLVPGVVQRGVDVRSLCLPAKKQEPWLRREVIFSTRGDVAALCLSAKCQAAF